MPVVRLTDCAILAKSARLGAWAKGFWVSVPTKSPAFVWAPGRPQALEGAVWTLDSYIYQENHPHVVGISNSGICATMLISGVGERQINITISEPKLAQQAPAPLSVRRAPFFVHSLVHEIRALKSVASHDRVHYGHNYSCTDRWQSVRRGGVAVKQDPRKETGKSHDFIVSTIPAETKSFLFGSFEYGTPGTSDSDLDFLRRDVRKTRTF
jgi:hypothetical protein